MECLQGAECSTEDWSWSYHVDDLLQAVNSFFFLFSALILLFQVEALQSEAEHMEEAPEEVLERLAQTEKLVVQLKDLIREKDALLQEKETVLKVPFLFLRTKSKMLLQSSVQVCLWFLLNVRYLHDKWHQFQRNIGIWIMADPKRCRISSFSLLGLI